MRHHGNTARSPKTSHKPKGKKPAPQPKPKPAFVVRPPHVPKIAVVSREQIFGGEICEVYMPKRGRREVATIDGRKIVCRRLMCPVRGGHVGIYVLDADLRIKPYGERMIGQVSLWSEKFEDGRVFPALHFRCVDKRPTHRLVVIGDDVVPKKYGTARVYRANPLVGFIIYQHLPRPM